METYSVVWVPGSNAIRLAMLQGPYYKPYRFCLGMAANLIGFAAGNVEMFTINLYPPPAALTDYQVSCS